MYLGADLSYVNELEDQGAVFYDQGSRKDPFQILHDHGATLVRVRLWHTPTWTAYSTLDDVQRTLRRAKALGMATLLDFHYSDTWADPAKQIIPAAWAQLHDLALLEQAVYDYTRDVLLTLDKAGLTPNWVQVGNEINTEILMPGHHNGDAINWPRNVRLLNAGLQAVRDTGRQMAAAPRTMLHIAQPENLIPWFDAALAAGLADFDTIGLSYYPKWSTCSIQQTGQAIRQARARYHRDVMIVETAYPWTLTPHRVTDPLLGADAVLSDYPATPQGQRDFLVDLTQTAADHGCLGVVYWEPAWVSTAATPSVWENATWFDFDHTVHQGIEFLSHPYRVTAQE